MEFAPITLDEMHEQMQGLKKAAMEAGQYLFKQALSGYFKEYPAVKEIQFAGWVPYFNDGDVCEFYIHEYKTKVNDIGEDELYYDKSNPMYEAWNSLNKLLNKVPEETFQAMFGNHFLVRATPTEMNVEEYTDHD